MTVGSAMPKLSQLKQSSLLRLEELFHRRENDGVPSDEAPICDIVAGHDATTSDDVPVRAILASVLMRRRPIMPRVLGGLAIFAMAGLCLAASASAQSRHADLELEALMPTTLGGVALTIESQGGTELATDSAA